MFPLCSFVRSWRSIDRALALCAARGGLWRPFGGGGGGGGGQKIDDLRRERVLFDAIYKKMERELSDRKKMMANIIEVCTHSLVPYAVSVR